MPQDATKRCTKCGEVKPLSEYNRDSKTRDGLFYWCRECQRRYREANREWLREFSRTYNKTHRAELREKLRRWRAANPQAAAAGREYARRWAAENPEKRRQATARVRARVFAHYGEQCACCGSTERLSIDHVNGDGGQHRLELYGKNTSSSSQFYAWLIREGFPEGFQTLCLSCNQSKGNRAACRLKHD